MQTITHKKQSASTPQNHLPEWIDEKQATRLFGLGHTPLFNLRKAGKIRSCSTRAEGQKYGKRLFHLQSIRDFLEAQEAAEQSTGGASR